MKLHTLSLGALLMATTSLAAVSAATAQDQTPPAADANAAPAAEKEITEVVVRGKNVPKTMRRTAEVSAILTTEDLKRTGDDNAAAALTRVAGLSIVEGKFIYVRGLGERYSSALLNGAPLPSPEPLQRVVPLDLFPASLLGRVSVQKTYSAEFPGEFGGGVVDLQTLAIPRDSFLTFGVGTGYNTETTGKKTVTYFGSVTDWLGYDDGARSLPDALRTAMGKGKLINPNNYPSTGTGATKELQTIGQSFTNADLNLLQIGRPTPNFSTNLGLGDAYDVLGGRLGVVAVGDFSNNWSVKRGVHYEDDYENSANNVSWNGLLSLGYTHGGHTVKWTGMYIRKTTKFAATRDGYNSNGFFYRKDRTGWYQRELGLSQLTGNHALTSTLTLDWTASYAVTVRDTPYDKFINYQLDTSGGALNGLYFTDLRNGGGNETAFSNLKDTAKYLGANLTWDYSLGDGRDGKLMVGASTLDNQRDYQRRAFEFKSVNDSLAKYTRVDYLFSDYNIRPDFLQLWETGSDSPQAYKAGLIVQAYYIKTDVAVLPLVRVAAGVRFENGKERSDLSYLYQTNAKPDRASTVIKESYVLPSATATWNFKEDMQLRFGASKTIGRPQFRELAEPTFRESDSDRSFTGNPFLKDTELTNLDARYEWYYGAGEYLTAGLFHKTLDNPVETISTGTQLQQTFVNAPKAKIQGFEVDYKGLFESPMQGKFFDGKEWLVQANYTFTDSSVQVKTGDKIAFSRTTFQPVEASLYIKDGAKLQGQSDHLANLQFGWQDDEAKSQATLLLTYVSERISVRGSGIVGDPDIMQEPGTQVDFVYRKGFTTFGRDLNLQVEARNLGGTEYKEYQTVNSKRVYVDRYDPGTSVSVSLSTTF
ncbi:TonB-dependent receptor [Asticcacaulis sp. BYS171W]|uniref:TonB-dependent receptor n=1 Tax=Asticcacaulis aquaticus TaxID=2984212 RepID=A0ABT5HW45_9CAUL|nr:TonB-dependent receptor [Asticcacaulis aquaticus]MDC7684189.1 TonB-dependent receptor [Asticcacaulis aquaticus]